eukprot:755589-Hanusia_phi.AAC.6
MIDPVSRNWPENARMLTGRIPLGNITNKKVNEIGATNALRKATTRELKGFDSPIWKLVESRKFHESWKITQQRPMVPIVSTSMDTTHDNRPSKNLAALPSVHKSADARLPPLKPSESPALDNVGRQQQMSMGTLEMKRHFERNDLVNGRNFNSSYLSNMPSTRAQQQTGKHFHHNHKTEQDQYAALSAMREKQLQGADFSDIQQKVTSLPVARYSTRSLGEQKPHANIESHLHE